MLYEAKVLIAFAIFLALTSCKADETKDPEVFVKDSITVLDNVQNKCQPITDDLENAPIDTDDNINKLKDCGKKLLEIANAASTYDLAKIEKSEIREAIKLLRNIEEQYKLGEDLQKLHSKLMTIINSYKEENIEDPDDSDFVYSLETILDKGYITRTEDINEINYYWSQVADKVGKLTWENFFPLIDLIKNKAKEYNLTAVEYWYPNYSEEKMAELNNFINELRPFYQELHAYIRFKLLNRYGAGVMRPHGSIPESLYQQVEDRIWSYENHYEEDFPASDIPNFDDVYENRSIDSKMLLKLAESYYTSLDFEELDEKYWKDHIVADDDSNCLPKMDDKHANNIKLNYCEELRFEHFVFYHELIGRIYGASFQKDTPWLYERSNFYGRIIGAAVSIAAGTKRQQDILNFLPEDGVPENWMTTDNLNMAFLTIFDLIRSYVDIRVITNLLANKIEKDDVNKNYWMLFESYAGVEPPIDRIEESLDLPYSLIRDVFDNTNLIREFETKVLAYDVYAAACHLAEHTGPLNECTFYLEKKVGEAFKQILSTGPKKPFNEAIKPLIPNYEKLNSEAILAYYEPTFTWMKNYNKKHNLTIGWDHSKHKFSEEALTNEEEAAKFVEESDKEIYKLYDQIVSDLFNKKNEAEEYETGYGNVFWKISKAAESASELTEISMKAKKYDSTKFKSKPLTKAISKLAEIADVFVLGEDLETFVYNKQRLQNLSSDDDIVVYKDKSDEPVTVSYDPFVLNVFKTSKDAEELKYYWEAWRDRNGGFAESLLLDILKSLEKAAKILEISTSEFWLKHYSNDYIKQMEKVIDSLEPFYHRLHYYVYENLVKKYSKDDFSMSESSIPDHLIQQVLAQIWTNESIVEDDFPYNKLPPQEQGLADKKYDALQLLKTAEEFYKSLGFEPLEESFWSERVKPEEGTAEAGNCYASIIDLTPKVYMKYCERVGLKKFLQAHGYLGRLHYAVEKKDIPSYYFNSYDIEFPVGEAAILSAGSPKHVEKIGLINGFEVTDEVLLNRLIRMAIHTMFNLHKYFAHTKVISDFLEGEIDKDEINNNYWKYMITYAGIEPPNDRRVDVFDFPFEFYKDLDQNHQVRKFTSEVLGYRIYEHLCKLSGHEGVLNNCDFSNSIEAGNALKSMMKLGSSLPRKTVLKRLLHDASDLSATSILNYYEPLQKWLKKKYTDDFDIPTRFDSMRKSLKVEYFT